MQRFYRILWSLALFLIIVTAVIFSAGIFLVAAVGLGLLALYRYYLVKKDDRIFRGKPFVQGEIIDLKAEVIDEKIQDGKPGQVK